MEEIFSQLNICAIRDLIKFFLSNKTSFLLLLFSSSYDDSIISLTIMNIKSVFNLFNSIEVVSVMGLGNLLKF